MEPPTPASTGAPAFHSALVSPHEAEVLAAIASCPRALAPLRSCPDVASLAAACAAHAHPLQPSPERWRALWTAALSSGQAVRVPVTAWQLDATRWVPAAVTWEKGDPLLCWRHLGGRRFVEPFFDDTLEAAAGSLVEANLVLTTPLEALATWLESTPHRPTWPRPAPLRGLIYHMSRCGSTLIAQMLASRDDLIVLSEADPVHQVLCGGPHDTIAPAQRVRWLRALLTCMGTARSGEEHLVIKLDTWHTRSLPLLREAYPEVPWVFACRHPVEVLVSLLMRPSRLLVPGYVDPGYLGLEWETLLTASMEQQAALRLRAICTPVLEHLGESGLVVLHSQLPDALCSRILPHLGLHSDLAALQRMQGAALRDAKAPQRTYEHDSATKQHHAWPALHAAARAILEDVWRKLQAAAGLAS